mgnify:FL=1
MNCPKCGASNPNGGAFCASCGAPLPADTQSTVPPTQPQYTQMPPTGNGIQQRNIALCIILSIVTCGIYGLYWLYTMTEDTNRLSRDPGATSGGIVILLSIVTCSIYLWYWMYKRGEILDRAKVERGLPSSNSGILYIILAFFGLGIVSYALIQNELNNLATA